MNTALALAAIILSADGAVNAAVTLDASVRDELRTGTAVALGGGLNAIGTEDALTPNAQVAWRFGENKLTLRYDPELLVPDLGEGDHLQVLNRGLLEYVWTDHTHPTTLVASEEIQAGIVDLFALTPPTTSNATTTLPQPTPILQPIPTVTGIDYEASNSVVDARFGLSRRTTLDVNGGYRLNGGANAVAQASFPLEQGPFATASLINAASRLDTLTSRLAATELTFSNGPQDLLLEATEEESRRLAPHLIGSLRIGVGATRNQLSADGAVTVTGYPEAVASLLESLPIDAHRSLSAGVTASVAPQIDQLTGTVFESFQLLGRLEWMTTHGLGLRALLGFNQPLYGDLVAAQQVELAQGAVVYQPISFLRLEAGGVGTWQQPSAGGPGISQWLAFAALVLQETVQR